VAVLRHRGGDLSARARYKVECLVRAGVGPADAVLDFGYGIGNVTCRLVERFHAVHGFEPSAALTRRAVSRCPFDDDAVLLWPREARKLLHDGGFAGVSLAYIVFFPRWLAFLRRFEPWLPWLPLGGQTLLIASKPVIPTASASS
jgi:trans-aconitate methyltransferase